MKNQLYFLTMLLLFASAIAVPKAFAQQPDNYYTIRDSWISYFNANPQIIADTNEDGEYQEFQRWNLFWHNRVDHADSALSGKLYNLSNAFDSYRLLHANLPSDINPNSWTYCGPTNQEKQHNALISALWVDTISNKHQQIIYAGTDASGIWKTTDGGLNWTNVTDASGLYLIGVNNIKGDPHHSNIIYAATGGGGICSGPGSSFGVGIICSTDAGVTWNVIYFEQLSLSNYILVDPNPPIGIDRRIYIGFGGKVIRMEHNGSGWTTTPIYNDSSSPLRYIRDIEFKPGNSDVLYVSTDDAAYPHWRNRAFVFKLTGVSSGNSPAVQMFHPFCDSLNSQRYEVAVNSLMPNSVFVIGQTFSGNAAFVEIWKSINSGLTWNKVCSQQESVVNIGGENVMGGGNLCVSKIELQISPKDTNIMYVGGNSISRIYYTNGNWVEDCHTGYYAEGSLGYHPDTRDAIVINGGLPGSHGANDTLICGNDGGVSKTTNGITTWKNLNGNGLWANEFWGIGSSEKNPYWMGGGTTHTGFFLNSTSSWQCSSEGDKGQTVVDFEQPNIVYNLPSLNSVQRSTTYGSIFSYGFNPSDSVLYTTFYRPIILNPTTSSIMIASDHDLWRNNHMHENTSGFYRIPVTISPGTIKYSELVNCISVAASDTSVMLLSYDGKHENDPNRKHKLLKSINSGASFIDLLSKTGNDSLLNELANRGITSLAISPTDTAKMWVTLGGFSGVAGQRKVYYSSDGGQSFTDISAGLPDFPVNRIRCRKGIDDEVFVGTDVGVFYHDNTLSSWQPFNGGLPVSMVTDIELLEEQEILRVSTYGRGVWQTYLYPCPSVTNPLIISRDTTWSTPRIMDRSIQVKAPATLTIRTRVRFPVMTKIMVEPGATLMCDKGCDLTNACTGMWLGIELWGHSTLKQIPANQGVAYFRNGAIVENARIGITTCKKDNNGNIDFSTTGGIIHANNCIFRNNFKAVEFLSYSFSQYSLFSGVNFETTGAFSDLASQPQTFVSLFNINGVCFTGCNFINLNANPYTDPTKDNGIGITSINSGFMVNGQCISQYYPCTKWAPSRFEGLYYGIKAQNTSSAPVVSIDRSAFINNKNGVYLCGVGNPRVTSSDFILRKNLYYWQQCNYGFYGLYLNICTGDYNVQENRFKSTGNTDLSKIPAYIGIVITNSGAASRQIYNNRFDTLAIGILPQGTNRSIDGTTGLCLKCNEFNFTGYDQAITIDDVLNPGLGIANPQGTYNPQNPDVKSPAGNTFSPQHNSGTSGGTSDIHNEAGSITYTYHEFSDPNYYRVRPDFCSAYPKVNLNMASSLTWKKDSACPSQLYTGGGIPDQLKAGLTAEDIQVASLNSQLSSLIDGGNTGSTAADVFFSVPPEALDLRNELMSKSPYLSDSVMKTAIYKEDVLPNAMIRDVLVSNPQSAKSEDVMNELDNRFVPMPDPMMNDVLSGKDVVGSKEQLEGKLNDHLFRQNFYLGELIRSYAQDTTGINATDSIIALLQNRIDLSSKYLLAFEYLSNRQTDRVNEILSSIPNQFHLTDKQVKDYQDYSTYLHILCDLQSQNLTIYDINSDQISQLQQLLSESAEPVKTYARNVLLANNLLTYEEPIILPDETKSAPAGKDPSVRTILAKDILKLFPNPANQYVVAEYDFSAVISAKDNLSVSVVSADGKNILKKEIKKTSDQVVIDCRNIKTGSYICNISSGRKILASAKFLIIR